MAEKWMHYYEVDFKDLKNVPNSGTLTWYNEDDETGTELD